MRDLKCVTANRIVYGDHSESVLTIDNMVFHITSFFEGSTSLSEILLQAAKEDLTKNILSKGCQVLSNVV